MSDDNDSIVEVSVGLTGDFKDGTVEIPQTMVDDSQMDSLFDSMHVPQESRKEGFIMMLKQYKTSEDGIAFFNNSYVPVEFAMAFIHMSYCRCCHAKTIQGYIRDVVAKTKNKLSSMVPVLFVSENYAIAATGKFDGSSEEENVEEVGGGDLD